MIVDPVFFNDPESRYKEKERIDMFRRYYPERIGKGMYYTLMLGGVYLDSDKLEEYPTLTDPIKALRDGTEFINPYGVCDTPEQVIEKYGKWLEADPRKFFITYMPIFKANQPKNGGWRWHKNGPYIGNGNPQYEYIADEEGFDVVYSYNICQILD